MVPQGEDVNSEQRGPHPLPLSPRTVRISPIIARVFGRLFDQVPRMTFIDKDGSVLVTVLLRKEQVDEYVEQERQLIIKEQAT